MNKLRAPDRRDGWYEIGPADAQQLLENQPQNRPLNERKAIRFASVIAEKKWLPNGETIILDERERLLDGQGRCRAIAISGKPIETYVVHNIPRKFFVSVDTGQARTGADTLSLAGAKNYAIAASVCRIALQMESGTSPSTKFSVTNERVNAYWRSNQDRLSQAIGFLHGYLGKSPIVPSVMVYVYMMAKQINPERADVFAAGVMTGEGLSAGSPMLALRNRMIALRGVAHKLRTWEKLALVIKAWNAFVEGRTITLLKFNDRLAGRNAESFPVFSDGAEKE